MKKKVLIIDDKLSEVEELRRYFEPEYEVLPNNSNSELGKYSTAFNDSISITNYVDKTIQEHFRDIRLIVSDLFFDNKEKTKFGGIDLIKHIRDVGHATNDHYLEYIPVIATSGVRGHGYMRKAYEEAKATLYIDKDVEDENGDIIGLRSMGRQLIRPFDDWCEKTGLCRYKVAFSFAGMDKKKNEPHRLFVREIAESLAMRCAIPVFFDEIYEAKINVQNGEDLASIYRNQCENIVVFLSDDYNDTKSNVWTSDEWRFGINPYIKETSNDNLCLLNLSDDFKKQTVLQRMFQELATANCNNTNTQQWDRIFKDIHEYRKSFYEIINTSSFTAKQSFENYYSFRDEKLKQIVDFIIKRFHLVEIN